MPIDETAYIQGSRAAWLQMLRECLRNLSYSGNEAEAHDWILEREATVAALRELCAEHGDNDWPDDLHLADVINKHLEL